jgi:Na+-transporting NADH:ubiquinone oxidoreductase subunit A
MHIEVSKRRGLDLPIGGTPHGDIESLPPPRRVALQIASFDDMQFKLLSHVGDVVRIGQPLLQDKTHPQRLLVSPAGGTLCEIRRGAKRQLLSLIIERDPAEQHHDHPTADPDHLSVEQLLEYLGQTGLLAHIRMRPFGLLARPADKPRSIFVRAVESAPFVPSAELQVTGYEEDFAWGLRALAKLAAKGVHLIYKKGSCYPPFAEAVVGQRHTVGGPHPCGNPSLHIHFIDPITRPDQRVWTLSAHDVIVIGKMMRTGRYHVERVVGIGGPGIPKGRRRFVRARSGQPIADLLGGELTDSNCHLISGDPLNGYHVQEEDFLDFHHFTVTGLLLPRKRQFLHFLRLGRRRYSVHRAYISGHLKSGAYEMTTRLGGEERAFIDSDVYDRVMPMRIPTALLVKAILADDYETAEKLGVLEVDAEDFALPTFICPSKIEMVEIVHRGLRKFAADLLS